MAAPNTMIVKITDGKDIRRFTTSTTSITYSAIHKHAAESFNLGPKDFKLKYKDDEGDQITMSTDAEILEAVGLTLKLEPPVLRLTLVKDSRASSPAKERAAPSGPPELAALLNNIKDKLPELVEQLPSAIKAQIGKAELDIAATVAATAEAMGQAAAGYGGADPSTDPDMEGVHPGVMCDKTGVKPIVGTRYHLKGHNYDLCAAEYNKLPDAEKAQFEAIEPIKFRPKAKSGGGAHAPTAKGFHPGVSCDKTNQCPIFGWRYHLKGHNYDLCEAEFNKLPDAEKANYEKIAPPVQCWGGKCGGKWGKWNGGWGGGWGGGHWGGHGGWGGPPWEAPHHHGGHGGLPHHHGGHGGHGGPHKMLAARFVSDVAIFDGTQMAPGTKFTKIWRLKNTGEVPWPPGTQIIFVGGDQMGAALTVPLARSSPVQPGEEVDVSVDLIAPQEHGRYVGYWRLTGPMGRKKWGQKVWTHIHVVDPQAPPEAPTDKEIEEMAQAASDRENDDGGEEDDEALPAAPGAAGGVTTDGDAASDDGEMVLVSAPSDEAVAEAATMMQAASVADTEMVPAAPLEPAGPSGVAAAKTKADEPKPAPPVAKAVAAPAVAMAETLGAMGFTDAEMVQYVIEKNGPDVDACARDLAALGGWSEGLTDLLEMGFTDSALNAKLMIKNGGSVKNTVRDLVADAQ